MVPLASFVLSIFCDFFVLDFHFCIGMVHGHATFPVVSYCYWFFMGFFLVAFGSCPLGFEGLGNWFGKEEI